MKKLWIVALILVLVISFVACGSGEEATEPNPVSTEEVQEELEATETPEELVETPEEEQGHVATVSYMDVSFSVPAEATIIGEKDGPVGSAFMVIYELPDSGGNISAIFNSMAVPAAYLEELGETGLLESLLLDNGQITQMFGRDVVRNSRDEGGYHFWFLNNGVSIAYTLTIGIAEEGSAAADFFEQILNTITISG